MGAFAAAVKAAKDNSYAAKLKRLNERRNPPTKEASDLVPMKPKSLGKKKSPLNPFQLSTKLSSDWQARQGDEDNAFRQIAPLSSDIAVQEGARRLKNHEHMAYMLGKHMRKMRPANELETSLGYSPEEIAGLDSSPGRELMIPMSKKAGDPTQPGMPKPIAPGPVVPKPVAPVAPPPVAGAQPQRSLGMRMSGFPSSPTPPPAPEAPTPFNNVPMPPELAGLRKHSSPIMDPIKHTVQDTLAELMGALQRRKEDATKITTDPSTHPAYYPSLALGVPKAFSRGFQDEHKNITGKINSRVDSDLAKAKAEFEAAMGGHTDDPALAKVAEVIDDFARFSVKQASGELNQLLNLYLGGATLLGSGTFMAGHAWAKKNDKNVQDLKAIKEYMRQRAYMSPPVILADTGDSAGTSHGDQQAPVDKKEIETKFEPAKSEMSEAVHAI